MKSTGIVRKVDELGRIVLPIELRRTLNIEIKDPLEIYVDGESIMLKKYQPACVFCGSSDDVKQIKGKNVCAACIKELQELDDYADSLGIELIPCIQTLAHLEQMFRWAKFNEINDCNGILLVDEPKTYELIEKMIASW